MIDVNFQSPLVSVVTVTYNSSAFVRDAIESVLSQEYRNFEYIIGDDCSTDETWGIIQEYKDERLVIYKNDINIGEYPNRNKAIEMAKGKYLLFVDGDDVLLSHGLMYYVKLAERFPEVALTIQRGYTRNVIYPAVFYPIDLVTNHYFGQFDLLTSSFSSNFFKLDILRNLSGLSIRYRGGDNHIRVKIASLYPVLFVQGYVSWPRETPGSASSKLTETLSVIEMYQYTKEFEVIFSSLDQDLSKDIQKQIAIRVSRLFFSRLFRFKIREVRNIKSATRLGWYKMTRLARASVHRSDFLSHFTSVKPYKRDFLV